MGDGRLDLDLNLPIRTATLCAGRALFSVVGPIVPDSDPQHEFDETRTKAQGLRAALAFAD